MLPIDPWTATYESYPRTNYNKPKILKVYW
jgi:hypothetical protein